MVLYWNTNHIVRLVGGNIPDNNKLLLLPPFTFSSIDTIKLLEEE